MDAKYEGHGSESRIGELDETDAWSAGTAERSSVIAVGPLRRMGHLESIGINNHPGPLYTTPRA